MKQQYMSHGPYIVYREFIQPMHHHPLCAGVLPCRIGLCFVAIFVLWDMKSVFYAIWQPFDWLVGYTDPRKGEQDRLHGKPHSWGC